MSLSDKLNNAAKESSVRLCKIGLILVSPKVSAEDRDNLKAVLLDTSPERIPNSHIAKILREEGFDVSNTGVDRHKRLECSCYRTVR